MACKHHSLFIPSPTTTVTSFCLIRKTDITNRSNKFYPKRLRRTSTQLYQTNIRADLGDGRPFSHTTSINNSDTKAQEKLFQITDLEDALDEALEEEEYASAAKIRDKLKVAKNEESVLLIAALLNYYDAFNNQSIDRIEKIWYPNPNIICQHPLTPCHVGYENVIASFKTLFNTLPSDLTLSISDVRISSSGVAAYVTCVETPQSSLFSRSEDEKAMNHKLLATSIFEKIKLDASDKYEYVMVHHVSTPIVNGLMVL